MKTIDEIHQHIAEIIEREKELKEWAEKCVVLYHTAGLDIVPHEECIGFYEYLMTKNIDEIIEECDKILNEEGAELLVCDLKIKEFIEWINM